MNEKYCVMMYVSLQVEAASIDHALEKTNKIIAGHAGKWYGCEVVSIEKDDA